MPAAALKTTRDMTHILHPRRSVAPQCHYNSARRDPYQREATTRDLLQLLGKRDHAPPANMPERTAAATLHTQGGITGVSSPRMGHGVRQANSITAAG